VTDTVVYLLNDWKVTLPVCCAGLSVLYHFCDSITVSTNEFSSCCDDDSLIDSFIVQIDVELTRLLAGLIGFQTNS